MPADVTRYGHSFHNYLWQFTSNPGVPRCLKVTANITLICFFVCVCVGKTIVEGTCTVDSILLLEKGKIFNPFASGHYQQSVWQPPLFPWINASYTTYKRTRASAAHNVSHKSQVTPATIRLHFCHRESRTTQRCSSSFRVSASQRTQLQLLCCLPTSNPPPPLEDT